MITIEFLAWDSEFFNKKIGHVKVEGLNIDVYDDICKIFTHEEYELVYIFESNCSINFSNLESISSLSHSLKQVDTKFTFIKNISPDICPQSSNIYTLEQAKDEKALYELGLQAGRFSRFAIDQNFKAGDFIRLYTKWVENSINKSVCDEVFIYKINGHVAGFITIEIKNNDAIIGLIAVSEKQRGLGIGNSLIKKALEFSYQKGCNNLYVSTQGANEMAVKFYFSCEFNLLNKSNIYHLWKI